MRVPLVFVLFCSLFFASCTISKRTAIDDFSDQLTFSNTELAPKHVLKISSLNDAAKNSESRSKESPDAKLQSAEKIIQSKSILIQSLFATQVVPYQGTITKSSSCLSNNSTEPEVEESDKQKKLTYFLMATENFVFGTCIEDQEIFRTKYVLLLCKNTAEAFEIKLFYPKDQDKPPLNFDCKS